ncbi:MAG: DUF799 family lipoprotein [Phycisphaeraceae bacterium]|nr:DUF799 family lipoprotein [Phycisphaeraceae bacterium]
MSTTLRIAFLGLLLATLTACQPSMLRYRPYIEHMPRSILVLPPVNNTATVLASDAFLSTVTTPLAERGYYVYPLAVVDRLFKDNGVPTPGDMHSVSLQKIDEIIGPDAVLYITINTWTTTYIVIDSSTIVACTYRLIDTKTGTVLWEQTGQFTYSSSQGQSNIIGMAIAAGLHAIAAAAADGKAERDVAVMANTTAFTNPDTGVLLGPRSPDFEKDQQRVKERIAREEASNKGS